MPEENRKDVTELATYITDGIQFHFVEQYSEVYDLAFAE